MTIEYVSVYNQLGEQVETKIFHFDGWWYIHNLTDDTCIPMGYMDDIEQVKNWMTEQGNEIIKE